MSGGRAGVYAGKLCWAPMVRAGELPSRLLALQHGCDLVWSPEIVDKKILQTERRVVAGTPTIVEYVVPATLRGKGRQGPGECVFRTAPSLEAESRGLVFQLGSCDAELAVRAALHVVKDVSGIDLNAGCPKHFSVHSGMGAALLSTPDLLCEILEALVQRVGRPHDIPISVKIRLLPEQSATLLLVERLCKTTGISNLTVHCRTRDTRNSAPPDRSYVRQLHEVCQRHGVSLVLNGGIRSRGDYEQVCRDELQLDPTRDLGGMIAESAERNPTVFRRAGPLPWTTYVPQYIREATARGNHLGNTKYMLGRMVPGKSRFYRLFTACKTAESVEKVARELEQASEDPPESSKRPRR
ncbi:tRNA-dihydrouridine(20) synthase (NAD(+)) KNAG_0D00530 [Huiozyma naganishii CBS 8797]|uniref:DUS-like FMN-binding domain-containing protein n=1 Tax=Huiozyma naganishii (strain ATCC MYA-139 / BCRC 22969 / CBS 8797 / KCTC 17520 / NBRC 10181 / NCYC 3082 / Yp74L-3) TaxID=1071383 RepID=J7R4N3_HUIN7|nr:hypothetical protein KNAG_0D00530 [Kazachstania naganishii CBS 8797]CCK69805.1 hypothetical protein KNAG_0D00530 [Kazachstania naganishii CBS 8797]